MKSKEIAPIKVYSGEIAMDRLLTFRDAEKYLSFCRECKNYGNNYACPPVPCDIMQLFNEYKKAYVCTHVFDVDYRDIKVLQVCRMLCDNHILSLEKATPHSLSFISGYCAFCDICARKDGDMCRHPEKKRLSFDSLSLDVTRLLSEMFGYKLDWSGKTLSLTTLLMN